MNKTPTTLIIMDGFGLRQETEGNAIRAAAKAAGQSVQAYVLQACAERMTREGQPLTLDPPADNK